MNEGTPNTGLYGDSAAAAPPPQAPGPMDLLAGIFTEPTALFKRLAVTPVWGWALGLTLALSILMTLVWSMKVDVDALMRPMLEANPNISADKIDQIIEMQGKFIGVFGTLQVAIIIPVFSLIMALFYWGIGRVAAENHAPSYRQAFSGTVVAGLVGLPKLLLIMLMCFLKQFGGLTPDKISPTSVGYFLAVDNVKLHALLNGLDLFTFAGIFMIFLAARHTLRLKTAGAVACAAVGVLFMVGLPVLFAK